MLPELRTVLCATDLEADSAAVLRQAIALARAAGTKLILVHVIEGLSPSSRAMVRNILSDAELKKIHDDGKARLKQDMLARLRAFCTAELPDGVREEDVIGATHIAEGSPAETIVAEAQRLGADVLVMGLHSRSVGSLLVGSVAQRVLHLAKVPVHLVPTAGAP